MFVFVSSAAAAGRPKSVGAWEATVWRRNSHLDSDYALAAQSHKPQFCDWYSFCFTSLVHLSFGASPKLLGLALLIDYVECALSLTGGALTIFVSSDVLCFVVAANWTTSASRKIGICVSAITDCLRVFLTTRLRISKKCKGLT